MMLVSKIKRKASGGIQTLKKTAKRLFGRGPKRKFLYASYCRRNMVMDHRVLFEAFQGKEISGDIYYLLQELLDGEMAEQREIFVSVAPEAEERVRTLLAHSEMEIKFVKVTSHSYLKVLATAGTIVSNYPLPYFFIKREGQKYLHVSSTPFKAVGKRVRSEIGGAMCRWQHSLLQADYLSFSDIHAKNTVVQAYQLKHLYTGKLVTAPSLVRRLLASGNESSVRLNGVRNIAYMPTWRGKSQTIVASAYYCRELKKEISFLSDHMKEGQTLFVHLHPMVAGCVSLEGYSNVRAFPKEQEVYDFLRQMDVLITDYSSVAFDFAASGRTVLLYQRDVENYVEEHGFSVSPDQLPFPLAHSLEELGSELEKAEPNTEYCEEFREQFLGKCQSDSPAQLLKLLLLDEVGELEVEDCSVNREQPHKVIVPNKLRSRSDLETIKQCVGENDIVQIKSSLLNRQMSMLLFDEYSDAFELMTVGNELPRTFLEEIGKKLHIHFVQERLDRRFLEQNYPNLKVAYPFVTKFATAQLGCNSNYMPLMKVDVIMKVETDCLRIRILREQYEVRRLLLQNSKNEIVASRDTSQYERKGREIFEDFMGWKSLISPRARYQFLAEVFDRRTEEVHLACFTNIHFSAQMSMNKDRYDRPEGYMDPFFIKTAKAADTELAIVPYMKSNQAFAFVVCQPGKIVDEYTQARLIKMRSKKSSVKIEVKFKRQPGMEVKGAVLRYRGLQSYDIPVAHTMLLDYSYHYMTMDIHFDDVPLRELYWDLRIIVEVYGHENEIRVRFPNDYWKCKFYLTNLEYAAGEGHMVFPYYTMQRCIAFVYRSCSEYDGYATKLKDMVASGLYLFLKPFLRKRRIWLVYEKFCSMAQDNGFYFFKYCMEELPEEEKKNIYFVIDKNAPDYENVKKYGKHVLTFMSLRHCLYMLGAVLYVGSDARSHLYAWRSKTSLIRSKMINRPIFFLQHGVTALKDVSKIFGAHGSSSVTYFTTTSQFEQNITVKYLQYKREDAPITGFTRWDVLEDTSRKDERIILLMPTWRSWLEEVSDEEFLQSDYYHNYSSLLQSEHLSQILEENQIQMIFYIHPKFAGYLKNFKVTSKNITLVPFGAQPLNEIIKKCHLLVTDYSSVCWDVYYQKKPVIFYQFDFDKYNLAHGSFIDMETELFGRRATQEDEFLRHLQECVESGFAMLPKDEEDHHHYFEYIDDRNSERTYRYLRERGY